MKKCTKCNVEKKENNEFFAWISHRKIFEAQCRECRTKRRKEIRALKPKKIREKRPRKSKEYYKAKLKIWREKNREKIRQQVRANYLKNKEKALIQSREWRRNNKEKFKAYWKKSAEKYPLRRWARKILNYYVETNQVIRPKECEMCKNLCKPDAHHDDYSKPLDVKWVCKSCHALIHKKT